MEDKSHLIAHFMAAGAEQRLEDYHFLRSTYETISGQEAQLNRILRMLDEDEIILGWHINSTPIGRLRSRSLYDFERTSEPTFLPGNIAYQRLREMEQEYFKKNASTQSPSYRSHDYQQRRKRLSEQHDSSSPSNSNDDNDKVSAARLQAKAEYEAELAESDTKRKAREHANNLKSNQYEDENYKSDDIEFISFSVRYEDASTLSEDSSDRNSLGRLLCEWISPSSSSGIDYYTIEHQLGDQPWLSMGDKIDKLQNQTQLDISSFILDDNNENVSSRFRLTAHLENGKTFTSKPTNQINISSISRKSIIIPNVEVLSDDSIQLTWNKDESDKVNMYDIEKKEAQQTEWKKVTKVPFLQGSALIDHLIDAQTCQFRLVPSASQQTVKPDDAESELLTVHNVTEWLSSLRLVPTSSNTVDVEISEEGFKEYDQYKVEYTTINQLDQWQQMPNITRGSPHLTIDDLEQDTDYKFRFTPLLRGITTSNESGSSQLSLVLDVKMPSSCKTRFITDEAKTRAPPPQFAIHQTDATSVLIEVIVSSDKSATFEDVFDVYSMKETDDDEWTKVATMDKDHLSTTIKNLEENTAYTFKIHNQKLPLSEEQNNIMQQFKFETASVKLYDPSLFLEKFEQSLENVVKGVMRTAAGHQVLEIPVNVSLNEVIREIFLDETLVPNEQYGFDTLALTNDLQLFRGPKQFMLQELEVDETCELSKTDGEIIIHNYRRAQRKQQPVIVREENGNTRIGNIDGDVIVRNVVTDVLLTNEETRNQLSMNIVGQAFLRGFQGILIASKFKGIIVVKNVNKP
ncbi:unnamed protein product [Rotaria magnacalcarata]|uniref:Fibronectin type-III domain-containing protein n=2 Tax=Rotaria magnacalcarata TaxID=392030 RepID=A0A816LZN5_9BILA|nr:unnamed protein product [Rotaria magnacalcarata]